MGIKLVIIDDAPFIREVVRALVENTEIDLVGEGADGESALAVVERTKPQVVLMDLVLPLKNGVEATKEILEKYPMTKIIACSTENQEKMIMRALEAGCCNFIAKPFKSEDLLSTIRKAAAGGT